MTTEDEERKRFEAWVSSPPFGRCVTRLPNDAWVYVCPGAYVDEAVDLSWCAWKEAKGIE
jgi:hypothetical protein